MIRGKAPDASGVPALRTGAREAAAERAVRALYGPLSRGVPLAVRNGDGVHDLLGLEETGWLLDEFPRLGFWFDPTRAFRAFRAGSGPATAVWTERLARRVGGVFAHGLGSSLEGGSHPEDVAPPWGTLAEVLPRGVPWVLDVSPSLAAGDVAEAVRYLGSLAR